MARSEPVGRQDQVGAFCTNPVKALGDWRSRPHNIIGVEVKLNSLIHLVPKQDSMAKSELCCGSSMLYRFITTFHGKEPHKI